MLIKLNLNILDTIIYTPVGIDLLPFVLFGSFNPCGRLGISYSNEFSLGYGLSYSRINYSHFFVEEKKVSFTVENDSNYDTPIDARLNEDNLSLVGNDEWPNQSFKRVHGDFDVDNFLKEQHAKTSSSTTKDTHSKESSTHARAALKKWASDHHKDTNKIDNLKATTDLSEPDEGWAFVDDNGTEYAIVRNGKVYPRPVIDGGTSSN